MNRILPFIVLFVFVSACAPQTLYRREAIVPSPQAPPYRGEPVGKKHMEFQVQLSGSHAEAEGVPEIYDDALWVPEFMINAAGMFGVVDFLDLGFLLTYAHGSWANKTAHGTPPMVDEDKHIFAIGPQIGAGASLLGGKVFFGGYASIQYARMPWSEWELVNPDDYLHSECYQRVDHGADDEFYYRLGFFVGSRPVKWVALHAGVLLHAAWKNIGFSNEDYSGSTLKQTTPLIMPLFGVRFDVKPVFLEASMTFPLSTVHEIDYFPIGWSAGLGVRI